MSELSKSVSPLAAIAFVTLGQARGIVAVSWSGYADPERMRVARRNAAILHAALCVTLATTSLVPWQR